ncbi:MAG: type pilus assembly protein PilA [Candidatus Sumerlaeota bacterium]|nr:type pilus assembly protein PilA [Candidatus Sumerlaeota bacterium]
MSNSTAPKAFTLIELLIVVAIIAILAAIAVPNFLEAQVRSKVSRAKSDMRTTATALEAYAVDYNSYPQCNSRATAIAYNEPPAFPPSSEGDFRILERLSTPVSYITTGAFRDPFSVLTRKSAATASAMVASAPITVSPTTDVAAKINSYLYQSVASEDRASVTSTYKARGWFLQCVGPDSNYYNLGGVLANHVTPDEPILLIYDPSNGTVSEGSVWRTGGSTQGSSSYAAGQGLARAAGN